MLSVDTHTVQHSRRRHYYYASNSCTFIHSFIHPFIHPLYIYCKQFGWLFIIVPLLALLLLEPHLRPVQNAHNSANLLKNSFKLIINLFLQNNLKLCSFISNERTDGEAKEPHRHIPYIHLDKLLVMVVAVFSWVVRETMRVSHKCNAICKCVYVCV